jgi:polar amino acid transport system permease protein
MYWKKKRISGLDYFLAAFFLVLAGYIFYRLTVTLNYKWQWSIIPTYLVRFDHEKNRWVANLLLEGLFTTIRLSIWATLLASLLGLLMGLMRTGRRLLYRLIAGTYVELIRNTPPLVLVFIFYFFVSSQILPLLGVDAFIRSLPDSAVSWITFFLSSPPRFTAFLSGVLTIALFQGAYITEIMRAGIESIEQGQWEASYALGLSRFQQMVYIILPQAGRRVLPPLANEFINTIKYSSIVSIISIQELTFQGLQIMAATQVTIEIWLTITIMYLFLCLMLSLAVRHLENRLARTNFQMQ